MNQIKSFSILFTLILLLLLLSCQQDTTPKQHQYSDNKSDIKHYTLLSTAEAKELLSKSKKTLLLQVSKKEQYDKEHIPNAHNIWRPDYAKTEYAAIPGRRAPKSKIENLLSRFGFTENTTLILYDTKGNVDALRFAWVLESHGFNNYKIINGGLTAWKQDSFETTTEIPEPPKKSNFILSTEQNLDIYALHYDIRDAIKDTNTILVDTREPYEYLGEPFILKDSVYKYKKNAFTNGHIPTAVHLNWSDLADLNGDHRIKSEKDLWYNLNKSGITPDKNIIVYCHSGSRSSHTYYVLKNILNFPNVANYDGSWIEWTFSNVTDETGVPITKKTDSIIFEKKYAALVKTLEKKHEAKK